MVRPTMMKTIMVVSQVSFQLGQVTFLRLPADLLKNCDADSCGARGDRRVVRPRLRHRILLLRRP